jgi:hypothetical protein
LSPRAKFGLLAPYDKIVLHHIARSLPDTATILEVGSFLGASAAIMSHANPTATVYSIDKFDDTVEVSLKGQDRIDLVAAALGPGVSWTIDTVQHSVKEYPNIKFLKGSSPYDFQDWDIEIDLYHEDGNHTLPTVQDNLQFWSGKVKPGGLILCHDYKPDLPVDDASRCPDVEISIDELIATGVAKFVLQVSHFAILQKT